MREPLERDDLFSPLREGDHGIVHLIARQFVGWFRISRAIQHALALTLPEVYLTGHLSNVMVYSGHVDGSELGVFWTKI